MKHTSSMRLVRLQITRILVGSVLLALPLGCMPEKNNREEKVQRYETGNISRRYYLVNGKKEGIMTDYYPDGSVLGERLFENDRQHGRTVLYYRSGKIQEAQYYTHGLREGGDTIWYENGNVQFVTAFKQGKRHGYLRKWDTSGTLVFEAQYEMDAVIEINGEKLKTPLTSDVPSADSKLLPPEALPK